MQIPSRYIIFSLLIITFIAGFLRFYKIDQVPVSLYWDEVASTYNAYSIAQTGRDEYGIVMPLLFRSFNDYKMSGNIYFTALIVKIFGLNEFSARASSAFFGTLTVLVTFFLIRELFSLNKKLQGIGKTKFFPFLSLPIKMYNPTLLGLLTSGLLAISPWHIQFSRTGFEGNVALFFVVCGMWLLLKSIYKSFYFPFAMVVLGLSFYIYRSVYVFLPLLLISFFINFRKDFKWRQHTHNFILGFSIFFILTIPIVSQSLSEKGLARVRQVNVFTNSNQEVADYVKLAEQSGNTFLSKVFYNRRIVFLKKVANNYILHFGPNFLFVTGDKNLRHSPRGVGQLYLWEFPFFIIGILISLRFAKKVRNIIFSWFLFAPIPAALSLDAPHALRSLNILPIPQLFTVMGLVTIIFLLHSWMRMIFSVVVSILVIFFFAGYLFFYYVITAPFSSSYWADGYKQLTQYVFAHEKSYDKVVISGHYWQPYIYFLFYKQYDPKLFQIYGNKKGFANYVFGGTSWDQEQWSQELGDIDLKKFAHAKHLLVALSPDEYEGQKTTVHKLTEIRNHNNELIFIISEL